jgi:hypothetical protein
MAQPNERLPDVSMDVANLYREEIITDRRIGTLRVMTPIKTDGSPDTARKTAYVGEAQLMTSVGALPLSFDIEADSLDAAVQGYGPAAKKAFEQALRELEEMRRQAASSLVIPRGGAGGLPGGGMGPGGLPPGMGGGKIQMP